MFSDPPGTRRAKHDARLVAALSPDRFDEIIAEAEATDSVEHLRARITRTIGMNSPKKPRGGDRRSASFNEQRCSLVDTPTERRVKSDARRVAELSRAEKNADRAHLTLATATNRAYGASIVNGKQEPDMSTPATPYHVTGHNKRHTGRALCGAAVAPERAVEFDFETPTGARLCRECDRIARGIAYRVAGSADGRPTRFSAGARTAPGDAR